MQTYQKHVTWKLHQNAAAPTPPPGGSYRAAGVSKSARLRSVPTVQGTTVWQMFTEVTWAADVSAKNAYWQVCETSSERSLAVIRRYGDCTLDGRFILFRILDFWSQSEVFYVWYVRRTLWYEIMGLCFELRIHRTGFVRTAAFYISKYCVRRERTSSGIPLQTYFTVHDTYLHHGAEPFLRS